MPSTYEHKALIEQLRNLSAEKSAAENPSESIVNTTHPSGDSSVDDDGTAPATTGERYAENTSDDSALNPSGTENAPVNAAVNVNDPAMPGVDADTVTVSADSTPEDNDPQPNSVTKDASVESLLKEASEIGAALRDLIKASSSDEEEEASDDSSEEMDYEDEDSSESSEEASDEGAADKEAAAEIKGIATTLKQAADTDADSFASVIFSVIKKSMPGAEMADEEAEEILARMAMADAAPAEEAPAEEEVIEEALGAEEVSGDEEEVTEEAPAEEELLEAAVSGMAAEEAPAEEAPAEEELSPEEQMMLMQLLGSEGMAPDDVEAYGKMSALLDSGQISGSSMSKAQQDYFMSCHQSAKTAQARFDNWKASSVLSNELNGIYRRGAK